MTVVWSAGAHCDVEVFWELRRLLYEMYIFKGLLSSTSHSTNFHLTTF